MKRITPMMPMFCLMAARSCATASGSYTSDDSLGNAGVGSAM